MCYEQVNSGFVNTFIISLNAPSFQRRTLSLSETYEDLARNLRR